MNSNIFSSGAIDELNAMIRQRGRLVVRDERGQVIGRALRIAEDPSSARRWLFIETGLFNTQATIDTRFLKWGGGIVSTIARDEVLFSDRE